MQRALYSYRGGATDSIAIVAGTTAFAQAFWCKTVSAISYIHVYI
jgi:hypothetical protein